MATRISVARAAYLRASSGSVVWGVSDCGTSAAAAIEAATGFDPWRFFRGRYQDRKTLEQLSGAPAALLVRRIARFQKWLPVTSLEGLCIGLIRSDEGHAVVMGFGGERPCWLGRGGHGVVWLHEPKIIRAWRVC